MKPTDIRTLPSGLTSLLVTLALAAAAAAQPQVPVSASLRPAVMGLRAACPPAILSSGGWISGAVILGDTGIGMSVRGEQFWLDKTKANQIRPHARPAAPEHN